MNHNDNHQQHHQQQQPPHHLSHLQQQQYQHQNLQRFTSSMAKRKQKLHEYSSASPPLTEDSGQWSSSFPSSPIKEQSPHNSGSQHVKSSSGSTSSCEFNNNSRKSELYGTPHWWPIENQQLQHQQQVDGEKADRVLHEKISSSDPAPASASGTKEVASATTPSYKYNRPLAFTINFHDDDSPDDIDKEADEVVIAPKELESSPLEEPPPAAVKPEEESESEKVLVPLAEPISDVKSDNGTYTLEDDDSSYVPDDRGAALGLNQIDNNDWIQKWATEASAHVPNIQPIPPYDETFKILDETRSIVNAMQDRVSSDTKPKPKLKPEHPSSIKFNRTFNIRRNLNTSSTPVAPVHPTYDSDTAMTRSSMSDTYNSKQNNFSRADGGRFSLRVKKGMQGSHSDTEVKHFPYGGSLPKHKITPAPSVSRPLTNSPIRSKSILGPNSVIRSSAGYSNSAASGGHNSANPKQHTRSNSTITSRDIEMENWKRRKSYDPLKSAGMGVANKSKAPELAKKEPTYSSKPAPIAATKFVSPAPVARPRNITVSQQQQQQQQQNEFSEPPTPASSVHSHSPVPHDHCCSSSSVGGGDYVRVQDWIQLQQQLNRSSCEQLTQRKFEALDTLVISTIFSLTNKVRNLSLGLLKKIQPGQQDDENSALLEEMITQLSEMTTQHVDKQGQKSSSKELSGILKNVKKIEQVILVLDRVLCDQDDEESCSDC